MRRLNHLPHLSLRLRLGLLALPLALASCGDFPRPMQGHPGAMGAMLAHPPPPRLVVSVPSEALLGDASAKAFANDMAAALVGQTIPAFAQKPERGDWQLKVAASLSGGNVTPSYTIVDPRGHVQGKETGAPVPSQAWADGDPATLSAAAAAAAPQLAALLSNIDAVLKESNPNSLYNRPPRLDFSAVAGAPGDGDTSLALNMRRDLPGQGIVLVTNKADADYLMRAQVKKTVVNPQTDRIEIDWIIATADGKEVGRVSQLHDLPHGSLDSYWGDVAAVAAQQAALGVKEVISNNIGKPKSIGAKQAPGAPPPKPPTS